MFRHIIPPEITIIYVYTDGLCAVLMYGYGHSAHEIIIQSAKNRGEFRGIGILEKLKVDAVVDI